jgi:hypothetical protein
VERRPASPRPAERPSTAALAAGALLLACAGDPEPRQGDPFDSTRLVIQMGGMRLVDGRPTVQVALKNKTAEPLWVRTAVDAPEGGLDCELFEPIPPGASHTFVCPQDELVYDAVYAVRFEVYGDERRSALLEAQGTEFLFGAEFRELLEAARAYRERE